jgi:hypothetical protein
VKEEEGGPNTIQGGTKGEVNGLRAQFREAKGMMVRRNRVGTHFVSWVSLSFKVEMEAGLGLEARSGRVRVRDELSS